MSGARSTEAPYPPPCPFCAAEPSAAEHRVYSARLALQTQQQQLDQDGVMVGVSREALDVLLKHFIDTWNELHCCDDVNLSEGLSGGIADLCRQRDRLSLLARQRPNKADYEGVLADHDRLVRELDVLLNGEAGAAKQASLCDIVGQVRKEKLSLWRGAPAGKDDQ